MNKFGIKIYVYFNYKEYRGKNKYKINWIIFCLLIFYTDKIIK
jgi:hypothetical protein